MANKINTGGGAYVGKGVNVGRGGDFVGLDSSPGGSNGLILAGDGFPAGAILSAAFIGGTLRIASGNYQLYQPVTQIDGMFVYVPA